MSFQKSKRSERYLKKVKQEEQRYYERVAALKLFKNMLSSKLDDLNLKLTQYTQKEKDDVKDENDDDTNMKVEVYQKANNEFFILIVLDDRKF